ncbi:MAG: hypothetical protein QW212_01540 [Nitrososphaerales archaeon]
MQISTLFLCGYYGFGNLGDELLLLRVFRDIRRMFPKVKVFAWSADEKVSLGLLGEDGVTCVSRFEPQETVRAVRDSDVVVTGGGGLMNEYYRMELSDLFRDFGKNMSC